MINYEHKFIFIHIPRTGGTSIEKQFNYVFNLREKHWGLADCEKYLSNEDFNSFFKFSFIRNPWDIIISKYLDKGWYSSSVEGRGGEIGYYSGKSLKYFLLHYKPAKHEHGDSFFDYFDPERMDFIGRFENRKEDLKHISSKIGITINPKTKLRSTEVKKYYTEYYDDETRDIVAKKYEKDIEYFGYKFDG